MFYNSMIAIVRVNYAVTNYIDTVVKGNEVIVFGDLTISIHLLEKSDKICLCAFSVARVLDFCSCGSFLFSVM